jgi:branched-subunit amino acid ABC-type transport system permease component
MDLGNFISVGLNSVSSMLILAIIAIGLGIILGMMGVINLAHGSLVTIGAYAVWFVQVELGLNFWVGLIVAPFIAGVFGLVLEYFVVRHLYDRLIDTLLATWGIAIVATELIKTFAGDSGKSVSNPIPGQVDLVVTTYPAYRLFLIIFSVGIIGSVYTVFTRTNFGIRLRAVLQDDEAASLLGVSRRRTYQSAFLFGSALAGLAGALVTPIVSVYPDLGTGYLIQSFLAVILGGTATPLAVLPGSALIGGLSNIMSYLMQPVLAETLVLLFVVLIFMMQPPVERVISRWRETS